MPEHMSSLRDYPRGRPSSHGFTPMATTCHHFVAEQNFVLFSHQVTTSFSSLSPGGTTCCSHGCKPVDKKQSTTKPRMGRHENTANTCRPAATIHAGDLRTMGLHLWLQHIATSWLSKTSFPRRTNSRPREQ